MLLDASALLIKDHVAESTQGEQYPAFQGRLQGIHPCATARSLLTVSDPLQHLQGIEDAVLRNIQAVSELSDLVRTSFGPNGACHMFLQAHPF